MPDAHIILGSSHLEVEISPAQGARLTRITYKSEKGPIDITPNEPTGFHMVPYSNRIRNGRFRVNGVEYQLGNGEKHSNHGVTRNQPWFVADQDFRQVRCEITSIPQFDSKTGIYANFPFAFRASVTYKVNDAQLEQELTVENTGSSPMPVGGGFHPYFRTSLGPTETIEIRAQVKGEYPTESDVPLPVGPLRPVSSERDFRRLKSLPVGLDHCFGGWDGRLLMYWPVSKIAAWMEGSNTLKHLVLYSPEGKGFCAIEPVANMTNGINCLNDPRYDTGICKLEPGQGFSMGYSTKIEANINSEQLQSIK